MAQAILFIFSLLSSLILFSSSYEENHHFQLLDVSDSLRKARHVCSSHSDTVTPKQQQVQALNLDQGTTSSEYGTLSVTLHPRSSLHIIDDHNYTALTLFRLTRDAQRVESLLSRQSISLSGFSRSDLEPEEVQSPVSSGATQGSGEYFARIGVGQPVKESFLVIDTGSDITWLQCQPCSDCYQQSQPIFNPSASSTYRPLTCNSDRCTALEISACGTTGNCLYQVSYGDGSFTVGDFATDTVSFGSSGSVPSVALGCGHDNEGLFVASDGLLGLGGGPLSLPSQIKASSFSYCLVDRDSRSSSTLEFNSAEPGDSVLAPLLSNARISTYHYVGLEGFTVGGQEVPIPASTFEIGGDGKGGVIVDSGTAVTRLRSEAYSPLRDAFLKMTRDLPTTGGIALFDTCYDLSSRTTVRVPTVSFRFSGGKTLPLKPKNYLIPVNGAGKFCFAFAPTTGPLSIIGNVQQQGTRVSYNLANKFVGFSPNKC